MHELCIFSEKSYAVLSLFVNLLWITYIKKHRHNNICPQKSDVKDVRNLAAFVLKGYWMKINYQTRWPYTYWTKSNDFSLINMVLKLHWFMLVSDIKITHGFKSLLSLVMRGGKMKHFKTMQTFRGKFSSDSHENVLDGVIEWLRPGKMTCPRKQQWLGKCGRIWLQTFNDQEISYLNRNFFFPFFFLTAQ